MTNRPESLAYLFGDRQKAYSSASNTQSDGVVIAGPGRMVQFYEKDAFVDSTLREFVGTGLHAGHTCIVIATRERLNTLERQLTDAISQSVTEQKGYYIAVDAGQAILQSSVHGEPNWQCFLDTIGSVLQKTIHYGRIVRVYSEMSSIPWQEGNLKVAKQFEQYWSDLAALYPFFLYTLYPTHYSSNNTIGDSLPDAGSLQNEIRHRKETEAALQQLEARTSGLLAEREHLMELNNAKDEFISVASHQLRTPATGVKQYIGMLLQGFMGELTDIQRASLQKAYESNERQLKIVNDLLLVARVDAGKITIDKKPDDIVQIICDVANEQRETVRARNQTILLHIPKKLIAPIDTRYIRMVLENILNNASKYSADGLIISVSARRRDNKIYISIKDQGVGISKHDLPKLYQKFSRIYNDRSVLVDGTGLGLYWSKRIIELHHGELSVASHVGKGSVFTITLPCT